MRIVDLFKSWDADNSMSLTRDEFREGLKVRILAWKDMSGTFAGRGLDKDGICKQLGEVVDIGAESVGYGWVGCGNG